MKHSDKATRLLSDLAITPLTVKRIRVETGAVRDLALSDAYNKALSISAVSILGWIRDNYPISFEERKNIDALLSSLENSQNANREQIVNEINGLVKLASHYTK